MTYTPPKVWTWDSESGGKFASINRPISGATHDKDLPTGKLTTMRGSSTSMKATSSQVGLSM